MTFIRRFNEPTYTCTACRTTGIQPHHRAKAAHDAICPAARHRTQETQ